MKQYTAWYTIENIIHVAFEAENDEEAWRIASEMAENGSVIEEFGYEMHDLIFNLDAVEEE